MNDIKNTNNFKALATSLVEVHHLMQSHAVKAVNLGLTVRNWLFGFYIVEYEQKGADRSDYGTKMLPKLSKQLKETGLKNISTAELSRFRQFYQTYPQFLGTLSQLSLSLPENILGTASQTSFKPLAGQLEPMVLLKNLSFSHFAELIKIEQPQKRLFYEVEAIKGTWSVRELRRQISTLLHERTGMSRKPQDLLQRIQQRGEVSNTEEIIKSPFTFEFLGLQKKDIVLEDDLEQALTDHLQSFLLELGEGFCFEARQKKILIEDEYFFIDMVFYHRILHCHVLIELKVDEFKHHYIGQLNTYLEYYKRNKMQPDDNPPVGILLVTNQNKTLVEYAKGSMDNQLFVSKYLLELPEEKELIKLIEKEKGNNE